MRAIHLYCDLVSSAVLDGLQAELAASGVDIGARAEPAGAELPDETAEEGGAPADAEEAAMLSAGQPAESEAAAPQA